MELAHDIVQMLVSAAEGHRRMHISQMYRPPSGHMRICICLHHRPMQELQLLAGTFRLV
jgi:hypothetical protein